MKITFKFHILNSAFCNQSNIQSTFNKSEDESESQPSEAEAKTEAGESRSRDQDWPRVLQHWLYFNNDKIKFFLTG